MKNLELNTKDCDELYLAIKTRENWVDELLNQEKMPAETRVKYQKELRHLSFLKTKITSSGKILFELKNIIEP